MKKGSKEFKYLIEFQHTGLDLGGSVLVKWKKDFENITNDLPIGLEQLHGKYVISFSDFFTNKPINFKPIVKEFLIMLGYGLIQFDLEKQRYLSAIKQMMTFSFLNDKADKQEALKVVGHLLKGITKYLKEKGILLTPTSSNNDLYQYVIGLENGISSMIGKHMPIFNYNIDVVRDYIFCILKRNERMEYFNFFKMALSDSGFPSETLLFFNHLLDSIEMEIIRQKNVPEKKLDYFDRVGNKFKLKDSVTLKAFMVSFIEYSGLRSKTIVNKLEESNKFVFSDKNYDTLRDYCKISVDLPDSIDALVSEIGYILNL